MKAEIGAGALQDLHELSDFVNFVKAENIRSYLEIGSKHGGSLWHVGKELPPGSKIVSVDLPRADKSFKNSLPNLEQCIKALGDRKFDVHLFIGDSTNPDIVASVAKLAPFDLCFIDANHTEPFVRADWANYGPLARIVAFHDIGWRERPPDPNSKKLPIEVPKVWAEIKQGRRTREIRYCKRDNGIGILWNN